MKEWVENLLALQGVDLKIRNHKIKLSAVPGEIDNVKLAVKEKKDTLDARKNAVRAVEKKIRDCESEAEKINENIRRLLTQSAMVKKNNEYQTMMTDIENKKKEISDLETSEIGLIDELEAAKKTVEAAEKTLASQERSAKNEIQELKELQTEVSAGIQELESLRKAHELHIETRTLEIYKRLLSSNKGEPFVPLVQGTVCGYCRLRVTPQTVNDVKKGALTLCDNCSHMLYLPENP